MRSASTTQVSQPQEAVQAGVAERHRMGSADVYGALPRSVFPESCPLAPFAPPGKWLVTNTTDTKFELAYTKVKREQKGRLACHCCCVASDACPPVRRRLHIYLCNRV